MDRKESPHGIRDPSRAPEVAPSSSPIPTERESEGLQVEYDYTSGKEAIASGGLVGQDEQAAHYGEPATAKSRKWYRRKRWLLAIALLVVVILAAAVGAGVGASRPGNELDGQTASEGQNVHPGEGSQG